MSPIRRFALPLAALLSVGVFAHAKPMPVDTKPANLKQSAGPVAKTNVCSITINSSDEIEMFKASLPAERTNFVELTRIDEDASVEAGVSGNRSDWLKRACQRKIQCDVLVISGHFGGSFFGSSNLNLSMETLEELSCDQSCDSVLQNPKEVFLFGCNTLAGKKPDHRSPEEYRRVLLADGFSAEQADQAVAFRYSPLGDSFNERMRRVFRGSPRIYGFDSVGPSGKNVRGLLANYFKSLRGTGYYLPENLSKLDEATNGRLARALRITAFAQERGAKEVSREQIPVCYLENPKVPLISKLHWIANSMRSERSFAYLPAVNDWLSRIERYGGEWKDKEFEVLEPIMVDTQLRDRLAAVVARPDSAILGMQLKVLTFMKFFGWVHGKDYMKRAKTLLLGDLNQDFDIGRKDQICSYARSNSLELDLSPDDIPAARFQDLEFVQTLGCIAGFNKDLMVRAWGEYRKTAVGTDLYETYRRFLTNMRIPDEAEYSLYATVFPQGDRPLKIHESDALCTNALGRKPLWRLPHLQSHLLTNPAYVRDVGCYVKFNDHIFGQLMEASKLSPELRSAVVRSLLEQRGFMRELDDENQNRLMDLLETTTGKEFYAMASVWWSMENVTPTMQKRFERILQLQREALKQGP